MTFVTSPLTRTQLLDEIHQIVGWLQSNGIDDLVIEYGSGCNWPGLGLPWFTSPSTANSLKLALNPLSSVIRKTEFTYGVNDSLVR